MSEDVGHLLNHSRLVSFIRFCWWILPLDGSKISMISLWYRDGNLYELYLLFSLIGATGEDGSCDKLCGWMALDKTGSWTVLLMFDWMDEHMLRSPRTLDDGSWNKNLHDKIIDSLSKPTIYWEKKVVKQDCVIIKIKRVDNQPGDSTMLVLALGRQCPEVKV